MNFKTACMTKDAIKVMNDMSIFLNAVANEDESYMQIYSEKIIKGLNDIMDEYVYGNVSGII